MAGYVGNVPVPQSVREDQSFTATAGQTTFNTLGYTDGNRIKVTLNGVLLEGGGVDYTATNGSDVVLTVAAVVDDIVRFETFNEVQLVSNTSTTPIIKTNLTLKNDTEEDTDGGRESTVIFSGEQSGGEISTLAEIEASHDGTADDQKGDLIFKTNDGSDNAVPTERLRIDSAGNVGINTNDPAYPLEIETSSTGDTSTLFLDNTDTMTVGQASSITWRNGTVGVGNTAKISGIVTDVTSGARGTGLAFYTNEQGVGLTEKARILHTGGITFNGDTAAANALDDYEYGTWTPGFKGASSTNTATLSTAQGSYVKIGDQVFVNFHCIVSSIGSANGAGQITGLPFTVFDGLAGTGIEANGIGAYWQNFSTTIGFWAFTAEGGTNLMYTYGTTSATQTNVSSITVAQIGASAAFRGSLSYRAT